MSKMLLKAEGLTFPVDKEICALSEVLTRAYFERETSGDFTEPHELPLPKMTLPSLVACLTMEKMKQLEIKRTTAELTFEDLPSPFQKMVKDMELDSPAFKQLLEFQTTYQCRNFDELLGCFVQLKTRGKRDQELCGALGLVYDGDQISGALKSKLQQLLTKCR